MEGKPALSSDISLDGIYISSEWRWFLENMQTSRKKGGESKTFSIEYIENRLEKIIVREGEEGINKFRDKAREIAQQLDELNNYFIATNAYKEPSEGKLKITANSPQTGSVAQKFP